MAWFCGLRALKSIDFATNISIYGDEFTKKGMPLAIGPLLKSPNKFALKTGIRRGSTQFNKKSDPKSDTKSDPKSTHMLKYPQRNKKDTKTKKGG